MKAMQRLQLRSTILGVMGVLGGVAIAMPPAQAHHNRVHTTQEAVTHQVQSISPTQSGLAVGGAIALGAAVVAGTYQLTRNSH